MLVEGEEEIGSPALPGFLDAFSGALRADVVVFADAGNWTEDIPALTTSLRGGTSVVVEVRTLRHGVHSGMYGGPAPDALTALCRMLASLHDERGAVAVPGLTRGDADPLDLTEEQFRAEAGMLDGVRLTGTGGLTARLWAGPAIAVIGIDAPTVAAASNTLIPVARAKVSMRIAPGDDAAAACEALTAHLTAHTPWGAQVSVQPGSLAAPFTAPVGGRAYNCARSALGEAWGRRPSTPARRGIPFVTAYAGLFPDAEILITGVEDPGTRAHGSNESLHLVTFERACLAEALLLRNLDPGPPRRKAARPAPARSGSPGRRTRSRGTSRRSAGRRRRPPRRPRRPGWPSRRRTGRGPGPARRRRGARPGRRVGPARVVGVPGGHRADLLGGQPRLGREHLDVHAPLVLGTAPRGGRRMSSSRWRRLRAHRRDR